MISSNKKTRYRRGDNPDLDSKFAMYKKANIFAGKAYDAALSPKEADVLIKLWRKAVMKPWELDVEDVTCLVDFHARIITWRKNRKREINRLRQERARCKLQNAAKKGSSEAVMKLRLIKKANAVRSANHRKMKQNVQDELKKVDIHRGQKLRIKPEKTCTLESAKVDVKN